MGLIYFEDIAPGQTIELPEFKIPADLRDGHVRLYSEDWPSELVEKPRNRGVIPGPMIMAIAGGHMGRYGNLAIYYMLEYRSVKFHRPVCVGDTIRIRTEFTDCKAVEGKKYGHVNAHQSIHNQRNELSCERHLTYGILLRP